jgi:hypothetical protein
MTAVHIPGSLGQRLKSARFYAQNGRRYAEPLPCSEVARLLSAHGVQLHAIDVDALELDTYEERITLTMLLALSRVLGCSLLYLMGVEE